MLKGILKNKVFRVALVLSVVLFPFTSKYRMVKTIGPSMQPTMDHGEWVVIERRSSLGDDWSPKRLHNVLIKDQDENLNKRIIGLPGDTIEIKKGIIFLNGKKLQDPFGVGKISFCLVDENNNNLRYWNGPNAGGIVVNLVSQAPQKIPEGFVWVIGDNRRESWYGLLPLENIVGKILY